jgi:hypothetical protein
MPPWRARAASIARPAAHTGQPGPVHPAGPAASWRARRIASASARNLAAEPCGPYPAFSSSGTSSARFCAALAARRLCASRAFCARAWVRVRLKLSSAIFCYRCLSAAFCRRALSA